MPEQTPAVRSGDTETLRDLESRTRRRQRGLGPPDPVKEGGQVGMTERDAFRTAQPLGDREAPTVRVDAAIDLTGQRFGPAKDAQAERFLGDRMHGASDLDSLSGQAPRTDDVTSEQAQPRRLTQRASARG